VSTVTLCTRTGTKIVQCHYSWANEVAVHILSRLELVEYSLQWVIWNLLSAARVLQIWSFRRFRLGTKMRDALEKSLSTGAADGSGIQFANE